MCSALAVILGQTLLKWQESQQQLQAYQSHSSIKIPETRTWLKPPRTTPELGSLWPGGWNVPIGQTLVTWLSLEPIRSQLPEPCGLTVGGGGSLKFTWGVYLERGGLVTRQMKTADPTKTGHKSTIHHLCLPYLRKPFNLFDQFHP